MILLLQYYWYYYLLIPGVIFPQTFFNLFGDFILPDVSSLATSISLSVGYRHILSFLSTPNYYNFLQFEFLSHDFIPYTIVFALYFKIKSH